MRESLRLIGVRVWVDGKPIISRADARFDPGTITAIMGPSGAGKSTLLKTINRLMELYPGFHMEGRILLGDMDVYRMNPVVVRRRIGMVFQNPNPFPHLSIYDNVALAPRIHGLVKSKRDLDELVEWSLRKAMLWEEVKDRLDDPPTKLSGGQQQRLCLARTLALKPEVLLLDEPTANIDPYNTRRIEEAIREVSRDEGVIVVIVTHTPDQARRIGDRILYLEKKGKNGASLMEYEG